MTTREKIEIIAKKRNLEGYTTAHSILSDLSHDDLHAMSKKMEVVIEKDSSHSFDVLKELETARINLLNKQQKNSSNVHVEEIVEERDDNESLQLEWMHEETSETEEFTLLQSRKKKKGSRKTKKLTPLKVKGKQAQEDPSLPKKKGKRKYDR